MILAEIEKRPGDQFGHAIFYQNVFAQGEYISTCTLVATKLSDSTDVSATFLVSSNASIPRITATSGSTTTAVSASDAASLGFAIGDFIVNETKGYRARVTDVKYTAVKNDTLVFEQQAIAAANADVVSAQKAIVKVKVGGGADGDRVRIAVTTTTNLGNVFVDELFVNVRTV